MVNTTYPGSTVVLIPTCHRFESLQRTLASLADCDGVESLTRVVVVNNGPAEDVATLLEMAQGLSFPVTVLDQRTPGTVHALNLGLDTIQAEYPPDTLLLRTDDDVSFHASWLVCMREAAQRYGESALLGGRIEPKYPKNVGSSLPVVKRYSLRQMLYAEYDFGDQPRIVNQAPFGPNMGLRVGMIGRVRFSSELGLPECIGEETQFCHELKQKGGYYVYVPGAGVDHHVRPEQLTPQWCMRRAGLYGTTRARIKRLRQTGVSGNHIRAEIFQAGRKYWLTQSKYMLSVLARLRSRQFRYQCRARQYKAELREWKRLLGGSGPTHE